MSQSLLSSAATLTGFNSRLTCRAGLPNLAAQDVKILRVDGLHFAGAGETDPRLRLRIGQTDLQDGARRRGASPSLATGVPRTAGAHAASRRHAGHARPPVARFGGRHALARLAGAEGKT